MTQRSDIVTLADQFQILASLGRDLREYCAPLGIDLDAIAKPLQIDTDCFEDFEARVSFDSFCRLMEALAVISGDETFGLKFGRFSKPSGTGPFGFGLSNAPTFRDMLTFYAKYVRIIADLDVFNATIEKNRIAIEWTHSPLITQCEQFVDYSAATALRLFQFHAGRPFTVLEARFERREPRDKTPYNDLFSRNIRFGAEINELVLPGDVLDSVNPSADRVMFDFMAQKCEAITQKLNRKKDIITMLKEEFIQTMAKNDRAIADISRRLGMSERTLQRRLKEAGSSFWEVYENTRDELSLRLLKDTDLSLEEISHQVGYSSQSAYSRAVKRWHDMSPLQLRRHLRAHA